MKPDPERLYRQMSRIRFFEESLSLLWHQGLVPGEMHLGLGEEALVAGVLDHLEEGDALALDHRSTPPLVARGVDLESMMLECVGDEAGLCGGWGGHMHLFSREHLAGSSGIVGSSGPTAAGFAVAAQHLRPRGVAFAFFGDGAANQGMMMESFNLAVAWKLPLIFICKDNNWAITTRSSSVTGGRLYRRARSFGMPVWRADGTDVMSVWNAAGKAVGRARAGKGPGFIHARCARMEGHFLGDPLLRFFREPVAQVLEIAPPLVRAMVSRPVAGVLSRLGYSTDIGKVLAVTCGEKYVVRIDPMRRAAKLLPEADRMRIEKEAREEVAGAVSKVLERRERHG
jgi:acetoin:2,6-dichlorophenolindophenol oxidoreductase subunit alpha